VRKKNWDGFRVVKRAKKMPARQLAATVKKVYTLAHVTYSTYLKSKTTKW